MVCPWFAHGRRTVRPWRGSLRNRGRDGWELRIYRGVDADTGQERWSTKTVHGSRRYAAARAAGVRRDVRVRRARAGTVGDLLDRWLATPRRTGHRDGGQTRCVIDVTWSRSSGTCR